MSVFRRKIVFRDNRETSILGGASIVTLTAAVGAIVLSGSAATNTSATTLSAPSGAIVVAGPVVSEINVEVSASGPVVLSGSAALLQLSRMSASGAIALAGSAAATPTASGAIAFKGSATIGSTFTFEVSGAIAFSGSAASAQLATASGAVVFSGTAGTPVVSGGTVNTAASGAIQLTGSALCTIAAAFNVPNLFAFETAYNVDLATLTVSLPEIIAGNAQPASLVIDNGTYSINGGPFSSSGTTVTAGDSIRLRHVSAATYEAQVVTTLTLSGIVGQFVSVTKRDERDHRPPKHRRFAWGPKRRHR